MLNFKPYLESIRNSYDEWWKYYTMTDVVGNLWDEQQKPDDGRSPLFDFGLMVETVKVKHKPEEKTERLAVIKGLKKYANHGVLLIGPPGSGKSTALLRLLWELAENQKIPILIELRFYKTSIIELIGNFLKRHQLWLEIGEIEKLLFEGRFILLFDGVNELPSQAARQDLQQFRSYYQKTTAMVFSTRDLGIGGDLGIEKKLQMQPLTETQMRDFVCRNIKEQGGELFKQLSGRLREFAETPLLLWMLCRVFVDNQNNIPSNLGSVFRRFSEIYDSKLKQDILVTDESRRWWKRLLQHLAWVMTHGRTSPQTPLLQGEGLHSPPSLAGKGAGGLGPLKTEISVTIPIQEARNVLTEFLKEQDYSNQPRRDAEKWLDDLLKHHLIKIGAENQIEFHHQLLQEYYAAERLLEELPKLSNDELQWEYLNYLKWTEVVALMMHLLDVETQKFASLRLVKLALEVDWQLGARLAGEVKQECLGETIDLINKLTIPLLLKIRLLGKTKSEIAIPILSRFIQDSNTSICNNAVDALSKIDSEQAEFALIKAIKHPDSKVRSHLVFTLGTIGTDAIINQLITALDDEDYIVRYSVILILERIASSAAINELAKLLKNQDYDISISAVEALEKIGSTSSLSILENHLRKGDRTVRFHVAKALSKVGNEKAIGDLTRILSFQLEYGDRDMRQDAAFDLGQMGNDVAIPELTTALEDDNDEIRWKAVIALTKIKSENAANILMTALKDKDFEIRLKTAQALEKNKFDVTNLELRRLLSNQDWQVRWKAINSFNINCNRDVINELILVVKDDDYTVRWKAAEALGNTGDGTFIPQLIKLLKDREVDVRLKAVESLGKIGNEIVINHLITALKDRESTVRQKAVQALGKITDKKAVPRLIKALQDEDSYVRRDAAYALELIGCETATDELIEALKDEDSEVGFQAAIALGKVASETAIPQLIKYLKDKNFVCVTDTFGNREFLSNAIFALEYVQQKLKYYKPIPKLMSKSTSHNYALLIGVGECEETKLSLPVTVKDIQAIKSLLTDSNLCGYIDDNIRLLYNQTATKAGILENLNWLKQQAANDPEATILIYYSGHGLLDNSLDNSQNYYLIPHDTDRADIPDTALWAETFNQALQQIPAQRLLVIIDSCHAQGMASSKNGKSPIPKGFTQTTLPKTIIDDLKGSGRVVFTSCTGTQLSWIRSDREMSIYTYHFLEALQGAGNQPGDKLVKVSNLMNYLLATVPITVQQEYNKQQTPFFDFATEDFPVALLLGGKGLPKEGYESLNAVAQENIRSISNQVKHGVGIIGDRNSVINVVGGNNSFGNISSK